MARVRFHRDFVRPIGGGKTHTYPAGWEGVVEDDAVAFAAVDGEHGEFVGAAPERTAFATDIPADWETLNADDTVALAHRLGAGGEVNTKAAAVDYIRSKQPAGPLV